MSGDVITNAERRRWRAIGAGILLFASGAVLIAAITHRSHADVELELQLEEASFEVLKKKALGEPLRLSELGISAARSLEIISNGKSDIRDLPLGTVLLQSNDSSRSGAHLSLDLPAMLLDSGTQVRLAPGTRKGAYRIGVRTANRAIVAAAQGPVKVIVPRGTGSTEDFKTPGRLIVQPVRRTGPVWMVMDVALDSATSIESTPGLPARLATQQREERIVDGDSSTIDTVSTIRGGEVRDLDFKGRSTMLLAGDALHLDASGSISSLGFTDTAVVMTFRGRASQLSLTSGGTERTLMPTYLDWLLKDHGPVFLAATVSALIGSIFTWIRFWRNPL